MMDENERIREQLSAYLDGELDDAEAGRVEQVVGAEKELAVELERLREVRRLLRGLPTERAPKGFVETVLAQAERPRLVGGADRHTGNRAIQWVRYLATAAVLLVAVSVGAVVVATLWKMSDYNYKPGDGRPTIGPVAIAPSKDDTTPKSDKSNGSDAIAREKGRSRGHYKQGKGALKNGRDVDGDDIPELSGTVTIDGTIAKGAHGARRGEDSAGVQVVLNEDIFTSNIPAAAKEVELLFLANGLVLDRQVAVTVNGTLMSEYSKKATGRKAAVVVVQSRNSYLISNDTSEQRQWVVVAELAQAKRIVAGLKVVRANQDVGQVALTKRSRESRRPTGKVAEGLLSKALLDEAKEEPELEPRRSTPGKRDKAASTTTAGGDIRQQGDGKLKADNEGAEGEQEDQAVRGLGGNGKIRAVETQGRIQDKEQKKTPVPGPAQAEKFGVAAAKPATSPARAAPMKFLQRLVITLNYSLPTPAAPRATTTEGKLPGGKVNARIAPATQPADANKAPVTTTQPAPAK